MYFFFLLNSHPPLHPLPHLSPLLHWPFPPPPPPPPSLPPPPLPPPCLAPSYSSSSVSTTHQPPFFTFSYPLPFTNLFPSSPATLLPRSPPGSPSPLNLHKKEPYNEEMKRKTVNLERLNHSSKFNPKRRNVIEEAISGM